MGLPNVKAAQTPMAQCGQGTPYCGSTRSEDNSDLQDLHAALSAYRRIHQLNRRWLKLLLWRWLRLLLRRRACAPDENAASNSAQTGTARGTGGTRV